MNAIVAGNNEILRGGYGRKEVMHHIYFPAYVRNNGDKGSLSGGRYQTGVANRLTKFV